jgi:putative two-component system response regulator
MSLAVGTDSGLDKRIVLVVDDTPDNLSIMSGLLKDEYKVKVANSGERALKIANAEPAPHLILLDIMMPEMDGFEVIRRLKAEPKTQAIPVIFLSAKALPEDKQKGLDLGAVDYITKPIDPIMILDRVKAHIL